MPFLGSVKIIMTRLALSRYVNVSNQVIGRLSGGRVFHYVLENVKTKFNVESRVFWHKSASFCTCFNFL